MFRTIATTARRRVLSVLVILGLTIGNTAVGRPGDVLNIPLARAKSSADHLTLISAGDTSVASYVQYEHTLGTVLPYQWEARKLDGTVVPFGDRSHVTGPMIDSRWPITKEIDKSGNEVAYDYYYGGTDHAPTWLEYTPNPQAGIGAHARIKLEYDVATYCVGSHVLVSCRFEYASGGETYCGTPKLRSTTTFAVNNNGSTTLRLVHRIDLEHNPDAESCTSRHGPQRQLTRVRQRAYDKFGGMTEIPPVTAPPELRWIPYQ